MPARRHRPALACRASGGLVLPLISDCYPIAHCRNPRATPGAAYGRRQTKVLNRAGFAAALWEIASWPGYRPSPLVALPGLAAAAGLGAIWYKDESERFGLQSFKALGGAYAVLRLLIERVKAHSGAARVTSRDLLDGRYRDLTDQVTVTCATDGNHGRSVAWGARTFGCRSVIYIHRTVSEGRRAAIAGFGAEVVRTAGTYDDSVRRAAADAATRGWHVISDTSYSGYTDVPREVMQGYTLMAAEAIDQLSAGDLPTHLFVQGGVGGLAAAVLAQFWLRFGSDRPRFVVVEPDAAACLDASARADRPTAIEGELDTIMAGLSCGEVSLLAWQVLAKGADDFMTVPDPAAVAVMRLLADGVGGDPPLVAGESAVAGLAGALAAAIDPTLAAALDLGPESRILVFGTEGDTDPELYRSIVGRTAEAVRAAR